MTLLLSDVGWEGETFHYKRVLIDALFTVGPLAYFDLIFCKVRPPSREEIIPSVLTNTNC